MDGRSGADSVTEEVAVGGTSSLSALSGTINPADFVTVRISRLARLLSRQTKQELHARYGLSLAEWRCISQLATHGPMSSAELCRRLDYDRAQISRIVAHLDEQGVLAKPPATTKAAPVVLTKKGDALYKKVLPWSRERQVRLMSLLTPEQRQALDEGLRILMKGVSDQIGADDRSANGFAEGAKL